MFSNPIIKREFLALARSPKAWLLQVAIVVLFSGVIILTYPNDSLVSQAGTQSRFVFSICAYGLLASVLLIVPAFPATSVVNEKRSGSLTLVLNSPMSPAAIYFGKFAGVSLFLISLFLLTTPALATCFSMGGVSLWHEILPLCAVMLASGVLFVSLGLLTGTLCQSTDSALRTTYLIVFVIALVTLLPWAFLQGNTTLGAKIANFLRSISPITPTTELLGGTEFGSQNISRPPLGPWGYVMFMLLCSTIVIAVNIFILSRRIFDFAQSEGAVTDKRSLAVRSLRRLFFVVDPNRRKKGIGAFANPVFIKEFRTRKFGRSHWLLRILVVCMVLSISLTFFAANSSLEWGIGTISGIIVTLQIAVVVLIAPSLASGLVSSELENGGWDLLLLTPMRPSTIVIGKLLSVIWIVFLVLLSTLPGYAVLIWIAPEKSYEIYRVIVSLLLASGFTITLSAMISSFFRKSAVSTAVAYTVCTSIFAATMLVWLGREAMFGHSFVRFALLCNPVSGAFESFQTDGFNSYQLLPLNWWITGIATLLFTTIFLFRTALLMKPR